MKQETIRAGELFNKLLSGMFNNEKHQDTLRNFFATIVQKPGVKIRWAPVLQAPPGCGKDTLVRALAAAIGKENIHLPQPDEVRSPFNGWMEGYRAIYIDALFVRDGSPVPAKLKSFLADDTVTIERKMQETKVVPNTTNLILSFWVSSPIEPDRRFSVLTSHLKDIKDVSALVDTGIFEQIHEWLDLHPESFTEYFSSVQAPEDFPINGPAPTF